MISTSAKSVGALFAGAITVVGLSLATDMALHPLGLFPPPGQAMSNPLLALALAYRTVYGILGSYIAARLAPDHPMKHAIGLGVVGFVLSTVGAVLTWNGGPEFGPKWYPISLIITALPGAWIGGLVREIQLRSQPAK